MKDNENPKQFSNTIDISKANQINDVSPRLDHLTTENRELLALIQKYNQDKLHNPERIEPFVVFFRRCRVRILLVVDGLDFSLEAFGLRVFVDTLHTIPGSYVRFEITLAHLFNATDAQMMTEVSWISRRIKRFKFDDSSHFTPTMYDQVWLFGIATSYLDKGISMRGNNPLNQPYPGNRLGNAELQALRNFMNGGGGLFATGDHGYLGSCLSGSVLRARSMRLWADTSSDQAANEVSMDERRRNDTNRIGSSAGSQFDDQSDDIPQEIQPTMFYLRSDIWDYSFPHPLLCGRRGEIRIMPDHPHEGECVALNKDDFNEYPAGISGYPRPEPIVIAKSTVRAGNTASVPDGKKSKKPTQPHVFGSICTYDGHHAGVGRVVTDSTWHHFVNINLIGDKFLPEDEPKNHGFLYSTTGQVHFENIKNYYRNIAVWLSRPSLLKCMQDRILFGLVYNHRVIEAVTTKREIPISLVGVSSLYKIGRHARDVLDSVRRKMPITKNCFGFDNRGC